MPLGVAYVQDLNPATATTVVATAITVVLVLAALALVHRRVIHPFLGLAVAAVIPFVAWGIARSLGVS